MKCKIQKSNLSGELTCPANKSYTHRAIFLSALSDGKSIIKKILRSDDTISTINACKAFGVQVNESDDTITIENSINISRGLLEFAIHPESAFVQNNNLDLNKEIVLFCAAGGRSALAAKTLKEMGFEKVSHVEGGFGSMSNSGFKVIK